MAIDIRTRQTRKVAALPSTVGSAQLSPDGKHIAYTDASGNLYVMSPTGTERKRIARISTAGGFNEAFDWSPDSRRFAVVLESDVPGIVSITGEAGAPLVEGTERWERPIWSPDGRTILSQRQQVAEPDPTRPGRWRSRFDWDHFISIQPDGSGTAIAGPGAGSCTTRVPRRPCQVRDPSWQPLH
jgi:Tol biopolymer transport system component